VCHKKYTNPFFLHCFYITTLLITTNSVPVKWTNNGFIKPGTPNSNNPLPPQIVHNTALFSDLTEKSKAVTRSLLGDEGDLISMRLHTRNNEYIVSPFSGEGTLVVVQTAHSAENSTIIQIAEAAQALALEEEKKGGPKK